MSGVGGRLSPLPPKWVGFSCAPILLVKKLFCQIDIFHFQPLTLKPYCIIQLHSGYSAGIEVKRS